MKNADVTIVVGVMGAGKTFYCMQLCRMRPRVLIIDPKSTDPMKRKRTMQIRGRKYLWDSFVGWKRVIKRTYRRASEKR